MRLAFVCIQNAGRSQMATAFARRERARRGLEDEIEIVTGGTRPADGLHDVVITVMRERGFDLADRTPREITPGELERCEYVVAMGCTAEGVCPATWSEESRDWGLPDPHGEDLDTVREIRDTVEERVRALFDELPVSTADNVPDVTDPSCASWDCACEPETEVGTGDGIGTGGGVGTRDGFETEIEDLQLE